jgi:tRNA C32,U32 (ribose-2'-O)-methylase TrmJ
MTVAARAMAEKKTVPDDLPSAIADVRAALATAAEKVAWLLDGLDGLDGARV